MKKRYISLVVLLLALVLGFLYYKQYKDYNNEVAFKTAELSNETARINANLAKAKDLPQLTDIDTSALIALTNAKRQSNGIATLTEDPQLNLSASLKCADMINKDYWSHKQSESQSTWDFIDKIGYRYYKAGENLAYGKDSSTDVVNSWYSSELGHRTNLLDKEFNRVGFAKCISNNFVGKGPAVIVVQHLAGK